MRAEFFKDSNSNVWFSNAKDIVAQKVERSYTIEAFSPTYINQTLSKVLDFKR